MRIVSATVGIVFSVAGLSGCSSAPAPPASSAGASTRNTVTAADAKAIAQDGFEFGLPLVYIAQQADAQSNVSKPEPGRAPFNQFDHHRAFPDAKNNKIVGMNVDTLYSLANLDVTAEPMVLVVPPM